VRPQGPDLASVVDLPVPAPEASVPVRLYRSSRGAVPLVVWLHGGGWTIGSIATHDRVCRRLAAGAGVAVLSVGYRLAPEHPAPASVDDTVSVLKWVAARPQTLGSLTEVAVAGDSAGGTLAALACLRLRGSEALPALQVLVYANTDLAAEGGSMAEKVSSWGLDVDRIKFFNSQWVPDVSQWASPQPTPRGRPHRAAARAGRHRRARSAPGSGRGVRGTVD
jgi:acetyl esterase